MRLNITKNIDSSINKATALLAHCKSEERCAKTVIAPIQRQRKEREAFLFVASEMAQTLPTFMYFEPEADVAIDSIENEVADTELLKKYFGRVKSVIPFLNREMAEELEGAWSSIAPVDVPTFEPISESELEAADLMPTSRRSAEETKAGHRQQPR